MIVIGKRFLLLSLSIVILGALVLEASAQQGATATLSGAVKDSNGALVTGALVTVTQQGTGIRREATSNGDGFFVITNLAAGIWLARHHSRWSVRLRRPASVSVCGAGYVLT
jgi:hypothetical protein